MRIFHLWSCAGVGSIIAKFMDRIYGTSSFVNITKKWDKHGLTVYGEVWEMGKVHFALKSLLKAREFDLIHVHYHDVFIPFLKLLYPNKPVVLHYHGSDIRGRWGERRRFWSKADAIIVSTADLLRGAPDNAQHIPNPVDTDLFFPTDSDVPPDKALYFEYGANEEAKELAERFNLKLDIMERNVPYLKMPETLRGYRWYIDVKRVGGRLLCNPENIGSKTALEALACGLKVIRYNGQVLTDLLPKHRPENVVETVKAIYEKLLG